jgi:hypothetical protein
MFRGVVTRRWPEILLLLLGCTIRIAFAASYNIRLGYDFYGHARNIAWWMQHWELPAIEWSREAFNPPLYYALAGALARVGVGFPGLGAVSLVLGCLRLGLLSLALDLYLRDHRLARLIALALAAVLPASVHMDVMLTNEALATTLAMLSLVLLPLAFAKPVRTRWLASAGLGLTLGLAILTKVSSVVVLAALCSAFILRFVRGDACGLRERLRQMAPGLAVVAIVLLSTGWYLAWCRAHYGKFVVTNYDGWSGKSLLRGTDKPYWARRPPSYFLGWNLDIYAFPFYPSAVLPEARFFPQLVASTFADYYNYGLAPYPQLGEPARLANHRPLRPAVVAPAALSVAAGTLIAAITVAAWVAAWVVCWRRRAYAMLALLLVPLLAVAGQAHFAVTIGNDDEGLIKGAYLQFAAAPLHALFGLGVAWMWGRKPLRSIAVLALAALFLVAGYVVFCLSFA